MATYKLDIEKFYQGEYWTNVYYLGPDLTTLTDAANMAEIVVDTERTIHKTVVNFTRFRVSTITPGDFQYRTVVLNQSGLANVSQDIMPLWDVARVDLTDEGFKRPERKYYRLPLQEGEQSNTDLNPTLIGIINSAWSSALGDPNLTLVGPNGEAITAASTHPRVAMRQLRRGSKRKQEPVIPEP